MKKEHIGFIVGILASGISTRLIQTNATSFMSGLAISTFVMIIFLVALNLVVHKGK